MIGGRRRKGWAKRALDELELARREVRQGRFQRAMAVITAFAAIVSGYEAYAQHQRGAYQQRLMWTPVWLTPPTVAAALAALVSERAARRLLPAVSLVALLDGLLGFGLHVRGIRRLPGGFKLGMYNLVIGPPVFAPLLSAMVGVLGLTAAALRRESQPAPRWVVDALDVLAERRGSHGLLAPARRDEAHGRFEQGMALIAAAFALLAGGEAYVEHLRGSFNQRLMWTPVWLTPAMVAAGIGAACSGRVARRVLPLVSVVTLADGLLGFGLHVRGLRRMPGGFGNLQFNLVMGPPLFAPLLFSAVGLLGLIAALLRRERRR